MQEISTPDAQDPDTKRAVWFKIIEEYNAGGQTQVNFCLQRDINKDQFGYYLRIWRRINSKEITPSFQPVEVVKPQSHDKWLLNVAPGVSLELPERISLQYLCELILRLRGSLC